jgi:hypothetical protein
MTTATGPEAAPDTDEQLAILGRFQELFALDIDAGITLTNIYQELPICNPASICDIRGHRLELSTSQLQLAAISLCNEVFIRSPHFDRPVLGQLENVDARRGAVWLSNFCHRDFAAGHRETVRVRFKRPTNIIIHSGSNRVSGVIHDISLGGCCIHTLTCKGMDESEEIQIELKVIDHSSGLPNCTRIPSSMAQICSQTAPYKCIFRFHHTKQSEQFLSRLINQRQLEILKELRDTLL